MYLVFCRQSSIKISKPFKEKKTMFFLVFSIFKYCSDSAVSIGKCANSVLSLRKKCKITLEYIEMITLPALLPPQARRFRQTSSKRE